MVRDRQTCVGCGKKSPETDTNYTLISAQFGWRLSRYKNPDGSLNIEWRCPTCWRDFKRARTVASGISSVPSPHSDEAPAHVPLHDPFPEDAITGERSTVTHVRSDSLRPFSSTPPAPLVGRRGRSR